MNQMLTAITRRVSPSLEACELSFLEREPIDLARAAEEHRQYEACLESLGARVITLPEDPGFPDSVFVEDPVIVLEEVAVVTRMGAASRAGEADAIVAALAPFRSTVHLRAPATLEGGDVMLVEKTLYVGLSQRTNRVGVAQLAALLGEFGYKVVLVEVRGCLHFKSACCYLGDGAVLTNREWIDAAPLAGLRILDVPSGEEWAANVLRVRDSILLPSRFPRTREMLEAAGYRIVTVDNTELAKAESGLTCLSLLFET
jgi:dimethylargininase